MGSPAQVSQLVLQVDASVAVAQRNLQQLARVVNQSSGQMNASLATVETAHARLGTAFNNSRIAQTELTAAITRSVDAYGAGASPLRILTTEMGRLAEAATFMGGNGGAMGKLASFMSGPWGLAVLVGVSVLAKLVSAHKEAGESVGGLVDKMRKQAQQAQDNKAAETIWANSIDGLIDRNEKLIDTLQKRLKAEEDLDEEALRAARADQQRATAELDAAQKQLANLKAQRAAQSGAPGGVGIGQGAQTSGVAGAALASQIAAAALRVKTAQKAVADSVAAIEQSTIAFGEQQGKALSSASNAIDSWSKRYIERLHAVEQTAPGFTATIAGAFDRLKDAMDNAAGAKVPFGKTGAAADQLVNQLLHGKIGPEQFAAAVDKLTASLKAATAAASDAKKGAGDFGKQIGFAEAEQIAKGAGLHVTSGYRSDAEQTRLFNDPHYNHPGNPVARPVSMGGQGSAHEGLNGKWALDIAFAPGLSAESLKKLYGGQGVTLSAVYKESGHYHIEGSTSKATAAQRSADHAAQKQATGDDQFARESAQLDAELLQAKKQLTGDFNSQADLAEAELKAQAAAQLEAIHKQVDAHQITEAQGRILAAKVQEVAAARAATIEQQRATEALRNLQALQDQQYQFQLDDLKFADDMATPQAAHRKLQLDILDIVYQQKQLDLEYAKAQAERNGNLDQANLIQKQIDRLPTEKAEDTQRTLKSTQDPLQAWMQQVPHDAATINEALQSIEVQGIDNLASAIGDVVTGTKTLGQAFHEIANQIVSDIVQMTVKMLIFKAISAAFGGGGFGGGLGDAINIGGGTNAFFGLRAAGGPVSAGQAYIVGDGGRPELFVPSTNGTIVPSVPRISVPSAANSNGPSQIELTIVTAPSDDAWGKVSSISARQIRGATPVIVKTAAQATVSALSRKTLNGRS